MSTPVPRRPLRAGSVIAPIAAVVLLVWAGPALACDCPEPPPPEAERERVDAVFSGEVTELTATGDTPPERVVDARIEVAEVWEGTIAEVEQVRTHADAATCGYGFETGRAELIYATLDDEDRLTTNLCARTGPLEQADEDLTALGTGSEPHPMADGPTAEMATTLTVIIAVAVVLLILVTLLTWRRRRRLTG